MIVVVVTLVLCSESDNSETSNPILQWCLLKLEEYSDQEMTQQGSKSLGVESENRGIGTKDAYDDFQMSGVGE